MNPPLVSIVLPAFNRAGYLRSAIESVLAQSLKSWEMIVADDGSGPEAAEYLRGLGDPRIRVLGLPHSGNPSVARNAALRDARGTYVAFLDSDDLWAPNKLEVQTTALRARAQSRWSFTNVDWIDAAGDLIRPRENFVPREGRIEEALLTFDAYVALPTVLVERRLLDEAGLFDEELRFGEDYDLWLRLAARSDVVAVTDKLTRVRLHGDNHSHDRRGFYRDWLRLYEKAGARTTDPRLLDICRRKRAALAVGLAGIEAADGQTAASYRRLANALPDGWRYGRWWLSAARMLVSSSLPPCAKALWSRRRRESAT
jgi:glycosyltransferase involved in cell wall biosynthesis